MTFARNASVNGDWMLAGSLDKPPLSIYTSAISMMFIGITTDDGGVLQLDAHMGEFAGRLPNALYAILLVALMIRLAHDLYAQRRVTIFAGLLTATSPYLLGFGATAFTDMSLLFWGAFALWMTLRRRYGWTGVALGLAFWSKQQALFFVPMLIVVAIFQIIPSLCKEGLPSLPLRSGFRGGIILIILLVLLFIWDTARPDTSIFILGTLNNTPDSLIARPTDYVPRLLGWGYFGAWLLGQPIITGIFALLAMFGAIVAFLRRESHRWIDAVLWLIVIGYIGLHTVLAFNQYDRYLLVILPMVMLLCARGIHQTMTIFGTELRSAPTVIIGSGIILFSAFITLSNPIPIGGDDGTYTGIDDLADYLNRKPIATVIYDRWLGWELGYYMGQWTNKRRVHYPTPSALVADALALDEIGDRYLVAPNDKPVDDWLQALADVGFGIEVDYQQDNFTVYRLSVPTLDA